MVDLPILVTGANGFLGKATVNKLLEAGYQVYACGQQTLSHHHPNYHFIALNLRLDQIENVLGQQSFHAVIHLASAVPTATSSKLYENQASYLQGIYLPTMRLLTLLKNKTQHFILASSVCVYGDVSAEVTENQDCHPTDYYGMYKWFSEILCRQYAAENQHTLTILRFTQLFGPGEPHGTFLHRLFLRNAVQGKPLQLIRGGRDEKDLLWIDDAAFAIVQAVRHKKEGIFNISSGQAIAIKDIAEILRELSHHSIDIFLDDDASRAMSCYFSIEKAKRELGFKPSVSVAEGLRQLYKEGKEHERAIF